MAMPDVHVMGEPYVRFKRFQEMCDSRDKAFNALVSAEAQRDHARDALTKIRNLALQYHADTRNEIIALAEDVIDPLRMRAATQTQLNRQVDAMLGPETWVVFNILPEPNSSKVNKTRFHELARVEASSAEAAAEMAGDAIGGPFSAMWSEGYAFACVPLASLERDQFTVVLSVTTTTETRVERKDA